MYSGGSAGHTYQPSMQKARQNKPTSTSFKGGTEAMKDHVLISGLLSTKKWMKIKEAFIEYVGRTYSANKKLLLKKGQVQVKTMLRPTKPTKQELDEWDEINAYWFKEMDLEYMKIKRMTEKNLSTLQSVLWGQCDPGVQSKLQAHEEYDEDTSNIFELMDVLEKLCENQGKLIFNEQMQTWGAIQQVFCFIQPEEMALEEYHKEFRMRVKVAKKSGAKLFTMHHLLEAFKTSDYYTG